MNKIQAKQLLKVYGKPILKTKKGFISFARQDKEDIKEIERFSNKDLISDWKGLVWINDIYGQISLNELQRIDLLELEIKERKGIYGKCLTNWFNREKNKFDKKEDKK